jgi:hypothetical protein
MKNIIEQLQKIQEELKAPKNQRNTFGNYNYRSCEDILEAVKPLLAIKNMALVINDEIILIGQNSYIKSTATLYSGEEKIDASAYAKEPTEQKGMSASQITGACSSYARKYALNGLFLIDDTKDADTMENTAAPKNEYQESIYSITVKSCKTLKDLQETWLTIPEEAKTKELIALKDSLKTNLK